MPCGRVVSALALGCSVAVHLFFCTAIGVDGAVYRGHESDSPKPLALQTISLMPASAVAGLAALTPTVHYEVASALQTPPARANIADITPTKTIVEDITRTGAVEDLQPLFAYAETRYFPVSELTEKPVVSRDISPDLPPEYANVVLASVMLRLFITDAGDVNDVLIDDAAVSADVRRLLVAAFSTMKFLPGRIGGVPVGSQMEIAAILGQLDDLSANPVQILPNSSP
jgi:hypothetical protein